MAVCTFFGHRDCPDSIRTVLQSQIEDLIVNHGVDLFYLGNQGRFDALVRRILRELTEKYPHINYAVVLAYMPKEGSDPEDYTDTMLPEGIEKVPPRYAIACICKQLSKSWVVLTDKWEIICFPTLKYRKVRRSVFGASGDCSIFVPIKGCCTLPC